MKQQCHASGDGAVSWKGDNITYRTAHSRVQKARGKASTYLCRACGSQAEHWAYDGSDPSPKFEYFDNWGCEIPYSTDVNRYTPLCRGCHVKMDRYKQDIYRC